MSTVLTNQVGNQKKLWILLVNNLKKTKDIDEQNFKSKESSNFCFDFLYIFNSHYTKNLKKRRLIQR